MNNCEEELQRMKMRVEGLLADIEQLQSKLLEQNTDLFQPQKYGSPYRRWSDGGVMHSRNISPFSYSLEQMDHDGDQMKDEMKMDQYCKSPCKGQSPRQSEYSIYGRQ